MSDRESDEQFRRERLAEEDFEWMSALYRSDLEAFEADARRRIEDVIRRAFGGCSFK